MTNIKAIFLDIDNTILDFDETVRASMREGFAKFGLRPYEPYMYDVFTRLNNAIWQRLERKELTFEELQHERWQQVFDALQINFDGYTFEQYFVDYIYESAILIAGAQELLAYLDSKYIICAASNGPYEQQKHRLAKANVLKYFDYLFISEKLQAVKPTQAFFAKSMQLLNAERKVPILPEEILVIGDSLSSDMALGQNNGLQTCFFNRNGLNVSGVELTYTVTSLAEVHKLL